MADFDLPAIWTKLKPSAREMLYHTAQRLISGHSGTIELHCNNGGVRMLRIGEELRPSGDNSADEESSHKSARLIKAMAKDGEEQ